MAKLDAFLSVNKKRPSGASKNKDEKQLDKWLFHQQKNYKNKTQIMKKQHIYDTWTNFITKHKDHFKLPT